LHAPKTRGIRLYECVCVLVWTAFEHAYIVFQMLFIKRLRRLYQMSNDNSNKSNVAVAVAVSVSAKTDRWLQKESERKREREWELTGEIFMNELKTKGSAREREKEKKRTPPREMLIYQPCVKEMGDYWIIRRLNCTWHRDWKSR